MSIYATLWQLKFPRYGDDHTGCDWIAVMAQGVPAHVGTWSPGPDSEEEDPYSAEPWGPDSGGRLLFEDGSVRDVESR